MSAPPHPPRPTLRPSLRGWRPPPARAAVFRRRLAAVCFGALLGCATAAAATSFQVSNWQTQDGLPSNKLMAVVQASDGYIWIGTYEGLIRFDGVTFTLFDSTNVKVWHDSAVTSLHESRDGILWIGHADGAVSSHQNGVFKIHPPPEGWKGGKIQGLGSDAANDVWVLDSLGNLTRIRDRLVLKPESGRSLGLALMTCSPQGRIWVTVGGLLSELRDAQIHAVPLLEAMDDYVHGVCASKNGDLWVAAQGHLWKRCGEQWSPDLGALSLSYAHFHTFIETQDGNLIAGTSEHGALIISPTSRTMDRQINRTTDFAADWVSAVCEDHEGNIWMASGSSGLFKLREKKVTMLLPADAWQGRSVLTVTPASAGGLWVGTEGAGLYHLQDGNWTHFGSEAGLRNQYVWSVHEEKGNVWIGTWIGLSQQSGEHFVTAPGTEVFWTAITALLPASRGGMWVGSRIGFMHYRDGAMRWLEPEGQRKLREVRAIAEHSDGTVWVGCNGDGLGRIRDGEIRQFRQPDGLNSDFVQCLHLEPEGTLWIGTRGGGLDRFKDGRFSAVTTANGLIHGSICQIEDDGLGYFWISSRGGIMRVSKQELDDCADGQLSRVNCLSYGLNDGLLTLACSGGLQPASCKMADGRLVFATDRGLAVIDPREVKLNPRAPPVSIESLRAGERIFASGELLGRPIEVGPDQFRIEIKYAGLSFAAPEKVQFKRRLEGLESDWIPVGGERTAVYNYVPPGHYVFRVTASNNDGVWNPAGRSLSFVVLPHFWQTLWFKLLVLATLLLATGGVVWVQARRRLQRKLEVLQRQRAIEAERTRIARDMHDDLGANLTRITMLSETARRDLGDSVRAEEGLRQIYETARGVTRAMDEIVWAVNPKHDSFESLVYYFEKFAQDLLGAAGMRCRLDMPVEFPSWRPNSEVRHNLFLAFKEALNNAARHSGADTVTVSLEVSEDNCRLTVGDNGRGWGGAIAPPETGEQDRVASGNGLANMRTRMHRIGGACEVDGAPGKGCLVTFLVPANAPLEVERPLR